MNIKCISCWTWVQDMTHLWESIIQTFMHGTISVHPITQPHLLGFDRWGPFACKLIAVFYRISHVRFFDARFASYYYVLTLYYVKFVYVDNDKARYVLEYFNIDIYEYIKRISKYQKFLYDWFPCVTSI